MLNTTMEPIRNALQLMIGYCHDLQSLLVADKTYFANSDLSNLELSNRKKEEIIYQLGMIVAGVDLDEIKRHEGLADVVNELKNEIISCFQYVMVNNEIIYKNMENLKEIFDQIEAHRSKASELYDHTGSSVK